MRTFVWTLSVYLISVYELPDAILAQSMLFATTLVVCMMQDLMEIVHKLK